MRSCGRKAVCQGWRVGPRFERRLKKRRESKLLLLGCMLHRRLCLVPFDPPHASNNNLQPNDPRATRHESCQVSLPPETGETSYADEREYKIPEFYEPSPSSGGRGGALEKLQIHNSEALRV